MFERGSLQVSQLVRRVCQASRLALTQMQCLLLADTCIAALPSQSRIPSLEGQQRRTSIPFQSSNQLHLEFNTCFLLSASASQIRSSHEQVGQSLHNRAMGIFEMLLSLIRTGYCLGLLPSLSFSFQGSSVSRKR
ncbi:hypothetical protein GOP47_0019120 [Adiantum capillus-veneris]|uniref:Uncharacterized protein n=1 Tax=Adiantum capillus-veneris TaxID=13818 RepID=A0A9D4UFU4_ADICA|nr:hypothetical protein GOP47_0019120 [Adiantum capillus-veneris]